MVTRTSLMQGKVTMRLQARLRQPRGFLCPSAGQTASIERTHTLLVRERCMTCPRLLELAIAPMHTVHCSMKILP